MTFRKIILAACALGGLSACTSTEPNAISRAIDFPIPVTDNCERGERAHLLPGYIDSVVQAGGEYAAVAQAPADILAAGYKAGTLRQDAAYANQAQMVTTAQPFVIAYLEQAGVDWEALDEFERVSWVVNKAVQDGIGVTALSVQIKAACTSA